MAGRTRKALVAAWALVSALSVAAEPCTRGEMERLQTWLDGTHTLRGRFEQTLVSGALGAGMREGGRIFLERPGRMRWEYDPPDPKVAVVNGDDTLLYLPEDRQLIRGRLSREDAVLPALLSGSGPLDRWFECRSAAPPEGESPALQWIRLIPRDAGGGFEEIVLGLEPATGALRDAEVLDAAGNRMRYRFLRLRRNRVLPPGKFQFDPPPGTEILSSD